MTIPKNITKEDILRSIKYIDGRDDPIPWRHDSYRYDLRYDNKRYPPKYVISIANKVRNGEELSTNTFSGGPETNSFLEKLGFEIVPKEGDKLVKTKTEMEENKIQQIELNSSFRELRKEGRIEFITFHPSYSYEEFIEGITVNTKGENTPTENLEYIQKAGIFKKICKRALGSALGLDLEKIEEMAWQDIFEKYSESENIDFSSAEKFVLIIDEINRGNISKIFGELITLLEADKRLGEENELIVRLPYSRDDFGVPPNVYIIGTMNTADRSIALLDIALRRRFGFIEMSPDFSENSDLVHFHKTQGTYDTIKKSIEVIQSINKKICEDRSIGRDKQIGHSFFFKVKDKKDLIMVWEHDILPLLEEYCYSNYAKINDILFQTEEDTKWITSTKGIVGFQNEGELNTFLNEIVIT